ncbi:glutathione hydrolase 7-like isoform X2 [Hydractinia symbiolongicarpus]|uniref:glutathione hydrolase 7-like isoform X2 n=1 Tax=Hydractinia symbiolongicarpus TaxID=13093 RepID=UPI00254F7511|nr:glutathione hydrolase 7-like isoform X2 [Hydractinia symbiolongicarpus]
MGREYQRHVNEPEVPKTEIIESPRADKDEKKCCGDGFKVIVAGCIIFASVIGIGLAVDIYSRRLRSLNHSYVAITDAKECTDTAKSVLKQGGNAVDATIAGIFCLVVVRPDQISLAGGGFLLVHRNGKTKTVDLQVTSPNSTLVAGKKLSKVGVPGLITSLWKVHKKYGRLSWSKLVSPAIKLASGGFKIFSSTVYHVNASFSDLPLNIRELFTVNGTLKKTGETIKLPQLAKTLKIIMQNDYTAWSSEFNDILEDLVSTVVSSNNAMSMEDLKLYEAIFRKAYPVKIRDHQVLCSAVPSSGVLLPSVLSILNELPNRNKTITYEFIIESLKVVFAKKHLLQDPAFDQTAQNITSKLLSPTFVKEQADIILRKLNQTSPDKGNAAKNTVKNAAKNTVTKTSSVKIAAIDRDGEAVSLVMSLGQPFGAKLMTKSGIIMNNLLNDEVLLDGERPVSSMAPTLIFQQKDVTKSYAIVASADKPGLAAMAQVIMEMLENNIEAKKAVQTPRVYPDVESGNLLLEEKRFAKFGLDGITRHLKMRYPDHIAAHNIGAVNIAFKESASTNVIKDKRGFQ